VSQLLTNHLQSVMALKFSDYMYYQNIGRGFQRPMHN